MRMIRIRGAYIHARASAAGHVVSDVQKISAKAGWCSNRPHAFEPKLRAL
jgi:hypothetical protein